MESTRLLSQTAENAMLHSLDFGRNYDMTKTDTVLV